MAELIQPIEFNSEHKVKLAKMLAYFILDKVEIKGQHVHVKQGDDKTTYYWLDFTLRVLPALIYNELEDVVGLERFKNNAIAGMTGSSGHHPVDFLYDQCSVLFAEGSPVV